MKELLEKNHISIYELAKKSDLPYSTVRDIVNEKVNIENCSCSNIYKIASILDCSMEDLYVYCTSSRRGSFETFKSNVCHEVKERGDIDYIIYALQEDLVTYYWKMKWYSEAFYILGMVDYLSNINEIPLCTRYDDIRAKKLPKPVFPKSIIMTSLLLKTDAIKLKSMDEAIPEFLRFNIIESEIRNVC